MTSSIAGKTGVLRFSVDGDGILYKMELLLCPTNILTISI